MKILTIRKDGGRLSKVWGFFLLEIKALFSIVFLWFADGSREAFHSHAFHAVSWLFWGTLIEDTIDGKQVIYTPQLEADLDQPRPLPQGHQRRRQHRHQLPQPVEAALERIPARRRALHHSHQRTPRRRLRNIMLKVFYFVLTLTNGQQQEPIFVGESDCKVANEFALHLKTTADVTPCGIKWVKK
jgi:hypothetical protein